MIYGMPYRGSKTKIAKDILDVLPAGDRLVDLFGGGFAVSHCAILEYKDKWKHIYYNDINPVLPKLVEDAINGKYSYRNFKPEWVTRERFHKEKHTDGYVRTCWSFANDCDSYLYGRNVVDVKQKLHDFIVFGKRSDIVDGIVLESVDIDDRRLELREKIKKVCGIECSRLQNLEYLHRIQGVEELRTKDISRTLSLHAHDYKDYHYNDGDVIYCDIPYDEKFSKRLYTKHPFNHKDFFEWAVQQPCPVYYSTYIKDDNLGEVIWKKKVTTNVRTDGGGMKRVEALYVIR